MPNRLSSLGLHNRLLGIAICAVALNAFVLGVVPASAQAVESAPPSLKGRWIVEYVDRILGPVNGVARISEEESSATVTLKHPATGEASVLRSRSLVRDAETVTIVLEGESPYGEPEDGLGLPHIPVVVPEQTASVIARYGNNRFEQRLNPRKPSDLNVIQLKLRICPNGGLSGRWQYQADPVLRRDRLGRGRAGKFEEHEGGTGIVWGGETWCRPEPRVLGAFVIEDQLKQDRGVPSYKHPFQASSDSEELNRTILVLGRELPVDQSEPIDVRSLTDKIVYDRIWRNTDLTNGGYVSEYFERGKQKLLQRLPPEQRSQVADLDFIMLRAVLQRGVVPGAQSLSVNGSEAAWMLQFGDNIAKIEFVRDVPTPVADLQGKNFEPTQDLFYPEVVRIRVVTGVDLGLNSIKVAVGANGLLQAVGGQSKIDAKKVIGLKNTYVTAPIRLVQNQADTSAKSPFEVQGGERGTLSAAIIGDGVISVPAPVARAVIYRSPGTMEPGFLWKDYLRKAALIKADISVDNWNTLPRARVETISNYVVFAFHKFETDVTLGEHAAMLLLRDTFIDMMRKKEADLVRIQSDRELMAFRHQIEPYVWDDRYALYDIKVTGRDGTPVSFAMTYLDSSLSTRYKQRDQEQDGWVLQATKEALQVYRKSLADARQVAARVKDDDFDKLLALTGLSFHYVSRVAKTRLMRLEDTSSGRDFNWVNDMRARGWVERVKLLRDRVNVQQTLARSDTKTLLVAGMIGTVPVMMFGGTAGLLAGLTFDAADLAYTAHDEFSAVDRRDAEIQFARDASSVIGPQRVFAARRLRGEWHQAAFNVLLKSFTVASGFGLGADDYIEALAAPLRLARIRRGAELFPKLERFGAETLTRSEQRAIYTFLEEAHFLRATRKPMTEIQRRALAVFDDLDAVKGILNRNPTWARGFDPRTFDELKQLGAFQRQDLRELMETSGPQVNDLLRGPHAEFARNYLKWHPHPSIETLQRMVQRKADEVVDLGANGTRFYRQCSPDDTVAGNIDKVNWKFEGDVTNPSNGFLAMTITDPNGKIGTFMRFYNAQEQKLTMGLADRGEMAGWISRGAEINLSAARGVPSATYSQLRMMNMFKIGYGNSGTNKLATVEMSGVINARAVGQLNWVAKTYFPGKSFDELVQTGALNEALRYSRSIGYAEPLVNLAGFRVKPGSVRLGDSGTRTTMGATEAYYDGASREAWSAFLRRHGYEESSEVNGYFKIVFEVEPRG